RPYVVIEKQEDKEVFIKNLDLSASATPIPASLDVEGFLKTLEGVKNHKNFIEHLAQKKDGQSRLAYLNLVEPTLKSPNIELVFNDPARKKYIKAFKDEKGKTLKYLLITADNNETLITGLPVRQISYLQKQIRDADIIHSFIPPGRLANEQGALTPSGLPTAEFTTPELKNQAQELYTQAQSQEAGFKGLLQSIPGQYSLEAGNVLKSVSSIEEKLAYYGADVSRVDDLLRGAFIAPRENVNAQLEHILGVLEANPSIKDISPRFIQTQDNYKGAHVNFTYNGIPSEIQIHTPKSWQAKKKQDPYYKELRREKLKPTLTKSELKKLRRKVKELGQESDLDISLFASSRLTSPQYSPVQSELVTKSAVDLNATHEPPLNSKAGSSSVSGNAYNRLDSKLNQKSTSLTGGKGIDSDIQAPLAQDSTQGLKDRPLLLTYKNTQELVMHAKAEGLSPARIGQLVQERKQAIAGLLPYKREVDINRVIFKEDIKNSTQILLEGRQAYLSHAQLLQALNKAKELKNNSPSIYELARHHQSRLAQLQDRTLAYEWLKAFNLKSLDEPFIPQLSKEVQEALEPVLKGEQIKLTRGSLAKLEKRQRDSLLPHIKPALEQSDMILRDKENALIFVKGIEKTYYFTSVARSGDGSWTIRTNSYKTLNRLKNVVGDGGEVLHVAEKAPNILAETFKVKTFSNQLADNSSTTSLNPPTKPPLKVPHIEPNPAFGEHFKEFEGKGAQAVAKLLKEQRGQVAGAFYREDLGESGG
ncbi:PBECR2 nuclease fold domain-containing protein, partial [Helicobacter bizzozeronii]|uniref:PBECR2 nuclease fold domain-containing protein n=3 Tax=Helicobacter bizzozeronii TaxID=56877 RepID=UPI001FF900A5